MSRSYITLAGENDCKGKDNIGVMFNHTDGSLSICSPECGFFTSELTLSVKTKKQFIEQLFRLDDDARDIFNNEKHSLTRKDFEELYKAEGISDELREKIRMQI